MNSFFVCTLFISCFFNNLVTTVHLEKFTATASGCNALLQWTALDNTGDNYVIESSSNGIDFTTQQTVTADSLKGEHIYAVTLVQTSNMQWYRLKIMSADSNTTYSRMATVTIRCNKAVAFATYPNPVSDNLTITYEAAAATKSVIWVNDAGGKTVVKKEVAVQTGNNSWAIDMQALPPGLYYIQLRNDTGVEASQKVMKK